MERSSLEISIREESDRDVRAIRDREASEIRVLEEAFAAEMDEFRKKTEAQTDEKMRHELSRFVNIRLLERKKARLRTIEDYITRTSDEVMNAIRDSPNYRSFLLDSVREAAGLINSSVEVHLCREDMVLEKEITDALQAGVGTRDIVVREDGSIRWGGCIVQDSQGGRLFNATLERVFFRKSFIIRRGVMHMLKEKGIAL